MINAAHKVCSKCQLLKPVDSFNFRSKSAGTRHSYCRDCGSKLTRGHYQRHKQQYLNRNNFAFEKHRKLVRQVKARPCADCGVQYPFYVMDFDHREGSSKSFALNQIQRQTMKAILREIEKCDVVCSNCHRERTYKRLMEADLTL